MLAELSEAKKVELENGNQRIKEQEEELVELHQRMAQLSEIVDKQTSEIRELRTNIRYAEKQLLWNNGCCLCLSFYFSS